ncbi:inner centromere protein A isoform X2 [Festucalex cinctus]
MPVTKRENHPAATMSSVTSTLKSLTQMFVAKTQDFLDEIDNVHMVWLEEIQEEANLMFSRDFNSEPELMPKTPSQKRNTRRKRVSVGRQEEVRRRFSKGRRSNLRGSSVKQLDFVSEEAIPDTSAAESSTSARPKRATRKNKQSKAGALEDVNQHSQISSASVDNCNIMVEDVGADKAEEKLDEPCEVSHSSPVKIPSPSVIVSIPASERLSAEQAAQPTLSPGLTAAKIATAGNNRSSRRSSMRCSLRLRHSLGGLRHSMIQESLRRTSRQSMLKKKAAARKANTSRNSNLDASSSCESVEEAGEVEAEPVTAEPEVAVTDGSDDSSQAKMSEQPSLARITRSVAANSPKLAPPSLFSPGKSNLPKTTVTLTQQTEEEASRRSSKSIKRKAPYTTAESPIKRFSPPKKSQSVVRPNMSSFLHTVQKNQRLMMTPNSFHRASGIKSFIKHTTPLKSDNKMSMTIVAKERQKLEALKKKQEQEEERMRKMEEEKKKKQEEYKRKRDERLRKVQEAKVKEELREEEKKKKIEQKMASIDGKNEKRQAAELAKKRIAMKRQEDLEQKRKQEEEKRKKIQQAEEKRQQELQAKEEELKAKKLAEARQLERERIAAAERERVEREKALTLQRELERAAREKERRELEEKRKLEEQQRLAAVKAAKDKEDAAAKQVANVKTGVALNVTMDVENSLLKTPATKGLNVTVDVEKSPQSYSITPKGGNKTVTLAINPENYGMDQNSDDSTDDESAPRKPIPSWAKGPNLEQILMKQYFNPPDLELFFGVVQPPKLEDLFYKNKPRYFKRTSSAVWHSPPNSIKY